MTLSPASLLCFWEIITRNILLALERPRETKKRKLAQLKGKICRYCKRVHGRDYKGMKLSKLLEHLSDPAEMDMFQEKRSRYIKLLTSKLRKGARAIGDDASDSQESVGTKRKREERNDERLEEALSEDEKEKEEARTFKRRRRSDKHRGEWVRADVWKKENDGKPMPPQKRKKNQERIGSRSRQGVCSQPG